MLILLAKQNASHLLQREVMLTCPNISAREVAAGVIECPGLVVNDVTALFPLAFNRQVLPEATTLTASSIRTWVDGVVDRIVVELDRDSELAWSLHVYDPTTAEDGSIRNRQRLIRSGIVELLRKKRRSLLKRLVDASSPVPSRLVQVLCVSPTSGYVSITSCKDEVSPRYVSSRVAGYVAIADDKAPPSRAFKKLSEVLTLGYAEIRRGDSVVDLGASPGGWTHVAIAHGAKVTSIDRSPLVGALMRSNLVRWIRADAFSWTPSSPVDLLLCDVIAEPARTEELIRTWVEHRWCRAFIVTMKFKGKPDVERVVSLKRWLRHAVKDFWVTQLVNNRNEITWMGQTL
jgi:23S rRNA (cytidine2498-2'-O)-methyltransferase